jgi:hypothetical protein
MNCVILYRVGIGGVVDAVHEITADGTFISEFPSVDAAVAFADRNALFESGQASYQIVELDEL